MKVEVEVHGISWFFPDIEEMACPECEHDICSYGDPSIMYSLPERSVDSCFVFMKCKICGCQWKVTKKIEDIEKEFSSSVLTTV